MPQPKFVVADPMDLWLNIALVDLLRMLSRLDGFVLNDGEAYQFDQGGKHVRRAEKNPQAGAKVNCDHQKGSHGSILSGRRDFSSVRPIRWPRWWIPPERVIPSLAA